MMVLAYFVCAMMLVTILYFLALMMGSVALWVRNRLTETEHNPLPAILAHR
ncbi:MAG: hypothetical protein ABI835_04540 [Chloroflexota bacterium]